MAVTTGARAAGCAIFAVPVVFFFTCIAMLPDEPQDPRSRVVTAEEFGDRWPLTVPGGTVRCSENGLEFTFESRGTVYALNGIARSNGKPKVDPIWNAHREVEGLKMDLSPLFDVARALCDR